MFVQYQKLKINNEKVISKFALINGNAILEYNNNVIGIAYVTCNSFKTNDYIIEVASNSIIPPDKIINRIKYLIKKAKKHSQETNQKRNSYSTYIIEGEIIKKKSYIVFN